MHARCSGYEGMVDTLKYYSVKASGCISLKTLSMKIYIAIKYNYFFWL